ncbi:MAG: ethylbenzene dehydrogenase-related protein, partial [bacterium]
KITILLEWGDPTADMGVSSVRSFADAAAVQFSLQDKNPPLFVMGTPDNLVNIWYWSAARGRRPTGVEARYPGMAVDDYPFSGVVYPQRQMGHQKIASARMTERLFITGWSVRNPTSTPGLVRGVMDLNAAGFGTLRPQGPEGQNLGGGANWKAGIWRAVFTRTLKSAEKNDAKLLPGTIHPIAFAVWDGARRDRDGQKSVTTWYKLRIE